MSSQSASTERDVAPNQQRSRQPWLGLIRVPVPKWLGYVIARIFYFLQRTCGITIFHGSNVEHEHIAHYHATPYWIMTLDTIRTARYERAIKRHVAARRVLDLGTGAHLLLARIARQAGAKHIDALEANSESFQAARSFAKKARLDDTIAVHEGYSFDIKMAQPCDILIHEIVGEIASSEGALLAVQDAARRQLTSDAQIMPQKLRSRLMLVSKISPGSPISSGLSYLFGGRTGQLRENGVQTIYNLNRRSHILERAAVVEDWDFRDIEAVREMDLVKTWQDRVSPNRTTEAVGFVLWPEIDLDGQSDTFIDGLRITNWSHVFFSFYANAMTVSPSDEVTIEFTVDGRNPDVVYEACISLNGERRWYVRWWGTGYASEILDMRANDPRGLGCDMAVD